eukprot:scaffold125197_cov30-Tisochrysis_lutea.AAC.1
MLSRGCRGCDVVLLLEFGCVGCRVSGYNSNCISVSTTTDTLKPQIQPAGVFKSTHTITKPTTPNPSHLRPSQKIATKGLRRSAPRTWPKVEHVGRASLVYRKQQGIMKGRKERGGA